MSRLSHLDDEGRAAMVDVSAKSDTERQAEAEAIIVLSEEAYRLALSGDALKGDVLATSRLAGIMAAKKTSELIPLCHPLALSHAGVRFEPLPERHALRIIASAKTTGPTGVEMEALTAASVAALTVYDMVKAVDKGAVIESIRLLTKSGGKSGSYSAGEAPAPASTRVHESASAPKRSMNARATPRTLLDAAAPPARKASANNEREALRTFMLANRLHATGWAKSAGVPVNELYSFLNGRARSIAEPSLEKLAKAARARVADMLGRK